MPQCAISPLCEYKYFSNLLKTDSVAFGLRTGCGRLFQADGTQDQCLILAITIPAIVDQKLTQQQPKKLHNEQALKNEHAHSHIRPLYDTRYISAKCRVTHFLSLNSHKRPTRLLFIARAGLSRSLPFPASQHLLLYTTSMCVHNGYAILQLG